jgi:hypothetical protein
MTQTGKKNNSARKARHPAKEFVYGLPLKWEDIG